MYLTGKIHCISPILEHLLIQLSRTGWREPLVLRKHTQGGFTFLCWASGLTDGCSSTGSFSGTELCSGSAEVRKMSLNCTKNVESNQASCGETGTSRCSACRRLHQRLTAESSRQARSSARRSRPPPGSAARRTAGGKKTPIRVTPPSVCPSCSRRGRTSCTLPASDLRRLRKRRITHKRGGGGTACCKMWRLVLRIVWASEVNLQAESDLSCKKYAAFMILMFSQGR